MAEAAIVTTSLRILKKAGAWGFKTTGVSVAGIPDWVGAYRGHSLVLEFKQPGRQPTRRQAHQLGKALDAGAIAAVIHHPDEVRHLLALLDERSSS